MNINPGTPSFPIALHGSDRPPDQAGVPLDLGDLLATGRRHVGKLAMWCCLCVGLAIAYLSQTPSQYVASTLILLEPVRRSNPASSSDAGKTVVNLDAAQAESHIQVVKSERILRFVFDTLDLGHVAEFAESPPGWRETLMQRYVPRAPRTAEETLEAAFLDFMRRVGVRRIGQSYVLEISYTALDPLTATRTVNSITSAYLWDQIAALGRGSEFLQTRIADIKAEAEAAIEGVRLGRIPDLRFPDSDARVISAAIKPTGRSFPQSRLVVAFAMTFALATGFGAILMVHASDRRIRTRRQIGRHLGLDCLAELPALSAKQRRRLPPQHGAWGSIDDPFHRAIRDARAMLISTNFDTRHRSIGLVSWRRREGTTTVAACLAYATSAASERVVLVDGNLRDPGLTRALAPHERRGLTDSLLARDLPAGLPTVWVSDHLTFVPAVGGEAGGNHDAFVGLPEMRCFIDALQENASVVVDLPAVSVSSDARVIGEMLDGVVLVVEAARTTLDEAHDCIAALRGAKILVLGVILNRTARS